LWPKTYGFIARIIVLNILSIVSGKEGSESIVHNTFQANNQIIQRKITFYIIHVNHYYIHTQQSSLVVQLQPTIPVNTTVCTLHSCWHKKNKSSPISSRLAQEVSLLLLSIIDFATFSTETAHHFVIELYHLQQPEVATFSTET